LPEIGIEEDKILIRDKIAHLNVLATGKNVQAMGKNVQVF